MIQEASFERGFPQSFRKEYMHVIDMISKSGHVSVKATDAYNSGKEIYILSDGVQIVFPYRLYCPDDDHLYSQLTDNEKLIYDCIFTRSGDGHIREKHIRNILMTKIPEWCFPYIVRSSADYVYEIVNAIYECLNQRDNSLLQAFCRNNPEIVQTDYRRMYSYWYEYYRGDFPEFSAYTGRKLFSECLATNPVYEDEMISDRVREYIADNAFCSEYLFKDWESFLDVVYSDGGHVSAILWWDHCKKRSQHLSVGGGGYSDPDDPEYMYAETQFYEDGLETKSLEEVKHHISERQTAGLILGDKYFAFDLVPSFYLDE